MQDVTTLNKHTLNSNATDQSALKKKMVSSILNSLTSGVGEDRALLDTQN